MSLLQAQRQRDLKYPTSTLLKSSGDLGWSTMFAELRSHGPYEQPGTAGPHLEIALAVRGSDEGLVATKFAGTLRRVRPTTGTIWLRPIATKADECRMAPSAWEAIHLYMSSVVFARLKDDYNLPAGPERSIRYACGVQDELINQIGLSVLSEMMCPTSAGRMLVETSSLLLAVQLVHAPTAIVDPSVRLVSLGSGTPARQLSFDKDRNVYVCPKGKLLTTTGAVGEEFHWLLDGLDLKHLKPHRELEYRSVL